MGSGATAAGQGQIVGRSLVRIDQENRALGGNSRVEWTGRIHSRWSCDETRHVHWWVQCLSPFDVHTVKHQMSLLCAGGIYQLRQGQQRRIQVRVKPVQNSGTLPIICQSILNVAVGSVSVRNRLQIPLDSYQDEDLSILREKWSNALMRRRQYLDQQIQKLINKQGKIEGLKKSQ